LRDYEKIDNGPQGVLRVHLRYHNRETAFRTLTRISKPGRRLYAPVEKLPRVNNGLGIAIVSTSKGVVTDKDARKLNVGGEVLCTIW
jgi:small subunit ribosomal protein S8